LASPWHVPRMNCDRGSFRRMPTVYSTILTILLTPRRNSKTIVWASRAAASRFLALLHFSIRVFIGSNNVELLHSRKFHVVTATEGPQQAVVDRDIAPSDHKPVLATY